MKKPRHRPYLITETGMEVFLNTLVFQKIVKNVLFLFLFFTFFYSCKNGGEDNSGTSLDSLQRSDLTVLNKKIIEEPNNAELYQLRAKKYFEQKNIEAAISDMKRILSFDSSKADYYLNLTDFYFSINQTRAAKEILERCVAAHSESEAALLKLAEVYLLVKKYEESIAYCDKALKLNAHNANTYFIKGMDFKEMGDTAKAISTMQTAVEQDQQLYKAYIQLGLLCAAKRSGLALDYYDNALRIDPNSKEALYDKAKFLQDMQQWKAAKAAYEQLLKIFPEDKYAYYNLGVVALLEKKDYAAAIGYYNKALVYDPNYAEAYFARGTCYEGLNKPAAAKADYGKALSIKPDYTDAAHALENL